MAVTVSNATLTKSHERRFVVFVTCLFLPLYAFAVPGFEVTPSLLLAPFLILFIRTRADMALFVFVLLYLAIGAVFAVFTGELRRIAGAYTALSPLLFIFAGKEFARRSQGDLNYFSQLLLPTFIITAALILPEAILKGLSIRQFGAANISHYAIGNYSIGSFSFVSLSAPFYGKFGVLTFASILFAIIALSISAIFAINNRAFKWALVLSWLALVLVLANLSSLQIYMGIAVAALVYVAFSGGLVLNLFALLFGTILIASAAVFSETTMSILQSKSAFLHLHVTYLLNGQFDLLSSGRLTILSEIFSQLDLNHIFFGCGFCDFRQEFSTALSSAHFSFVTSFGKAGLPLMLVQAYFILDALGTLLLMKTSATRNIYIAVIVSVLVQSAVWDLFQLQVLSPIIFGFCGFILGLASRQRHSVSRIFESQS